MVLRNRSKRRYSRGCRSRNRKGGRKKSRRVKKRRKSRKSKRRKKTRRRRRRKRMRGGSRCPYNKNLGEQYTLRPYNNLSGPTPRGGYVSTNLNQSVPASYQQKGGGAAQNLAQGLGLGDLWGGFYGLGNNLTNARATWGGKPEVDSHKPMRQNLESDPYFHQIPDIKAYHDAGVIEAANKGTI